MQTILMFCVLYFLVHIIGRVNGTVFDERDVKFPLGEGSEYNIPEGLETALEKFKNGEKSVIKLSPKVFFSLVSHVIRGYSFYYPHCHHFEMLHFIFFLKAIEIYYDTYQTENCTVDYLIHYMYYID